jgi:hypothetical protein
MIIMPQVSRSLLVMFRSCPINPTTHLITYWAVVITTAVRLLNSLMTQATKSAWLGPETLAEARLAIGSLWMGPEMTLEVNRVRERCTYLMYTIRKNPKCQFSLI